MDTKTAKKYIKKIPDNPGVYFFMQGKEILYIGKATSLRDRVRSYFSKDLISARGPLLVKMIEEAEKIKWEASDSVLEAIILEAHYIKKHQPYYNSREKDNKSFNYVVVIDEDFPRVLLQRGRELSQKSKSLKFTVAFGPFPNGSQLKEALKIVRKIFPFRDRCYPPTIGKTNRPCFNYQIGLCPGVCVGKINKKEYTKNIRHVKLFFTGKKKAIMRSLEKEMKTFAKDREFEKADKIKKQIFALNHINDVALLKKDKSLNLTQGNSKISFRIEAYDIAHMSGSATVGVMVVVTDGEKDTSEYKKFKIRGNDSVSIDDTKNLKEIFERRLKHALPIGGWRLPDIIVVDGGKAQINTIKEILNIKGLDIEVVSVVKDERHKSREIIGKKSLIGQHKNSILLANSEAHRFAINYHRNLFRKSQF